MAEVVFVTGVTDVVETARLLLRRKYREAARVAVFGPEDRLKQLDVALWTDDPKDFLPHLRVTGSQQPSAQALSMTPVWLLDRPLEGMACESALNLGLDDPPTLVGFERVAELIGCEPREREAGRKRWKRYETHGFTLIHHAQ